MADAKRRPEPTKRMVADPSMTDAEFYHRQKREIENAGRVYRKPNLSVGKIDVHENLSTRIGGLALIKRRLDHHERAAEEFKNRYERAYGSANPAVDASRVQVDSSIIAHDSGMGARIDNNRDLADAIKAMGKSVTDIVVGVIVLGAPILSVSPHDHWRSQKSTTEELLMALDCLAVRWGYLPAQAKAS